MEVIDVVNEDIESMQNHFVMSTELWKKFKDEAPAINHSNWVKIKYFDGNNLNPQFSGVPTNSGGIYIFAIECPIVPCTGSYIMYVGRARKTDSENLSARTKTYYQKYNRRAERKKITRIFDKWKEYIYLFVLPITTSNDTIDQIEAWLTDCIIPPCNSDYFSAAVRNKVAAW